MITKDKYSLITKKDRRYGLIAGLVIALKHFLFSKSFESTTWESA
jgi:hypothetical protein